METLAVLADNLTLRGNGLMDENSSAAIRSLGCTSEDFVSVSSVNVISVVLGSVLVVENMLMIKTICLTPALRTNTNILVASLAVADLLMGLEAIVMGVYQLSDGFSLWFENHPSAKRVFDSFLAGEYMSLVDVSITHIAVLAIDRYLFVKWPFRYAQRVTRFRVLVTAVVIWTFGIIMIIVSVVMLKDPKYHERCIIFHMPFSYGGGPLLLIYFFSLLIVLVSTAGLAKLARDHRRRRGKRLKFGYKNKASPRLNRDCDLENNVQIDQINHCQDKIDAVRQLQVSSDRIAVTAMNPHGLNSFAIQDNSISIDTNITAQNIETIDLPVSSGFSEAKGGNQILIKSEDIRFDMFSPRSHISCEGNDADSQAILNKNQPVLLSILPHGDCITSIQDVQGCNQNINTGMESHATSTLQINRDRLESSNGHSNPTSRASTNIANVSIQEEDHKIFSKANVKIIKFVLIVFGSFTVFTLPPVVMFTLHDLKGSSFVSNLAVRIMGTILVSNSGMNLFILIYMNKEFRAALVNSWPCRLLTSVKNRYQYH